ncbi:hypothetical protein FJ366_01010 [Candidatus Dependentiae bacterium]|nr:hypothetical protein [Candidatus Dependentiae bacterium]
MTEKIIPVLSKLHASSIGQKLSAFCFSSFVVNSTSFIFSAPILLWWGLPISMLTLFGNIFFTPFLIFFILLSSLFTVFAALNVTVWHLGWILDNFTKIWLFLLSFSSRNVLFAQIYSPVLLFILILINIGTAYTLFHAKSHQKITKTLLCGVIFTLLIFALPLKRGSSTLSNSAGTLEIQDTANGLEIVEKNYFKGISHAQKQVPFNLKMPIIRSHGTCKISKITVQTISIRTLQSLKELIFCMNIKKISIPNITKPQKPAFWKAFYSFKNAAKNARVKIYYQRPNVRVDEENFSKTASKSAADRSGHKISKNANSEYAA